MARPSEIESDPGTLRDRAPRVEFHGNIRSTDQGERRPPRAQRIFELATRFLAGADDDGVRFDQLRFPVDFDVESRIVDALVGNAGHHRDAAALQKRTADPSRRLGKTLADLPLLALQQPHLARRSRLPRRRNTAAIRVV